MGDDDTHQRGRLPWWQWAMIAISAIFVLVAYSSFRRPMLYDEFVFYALGGLPTTGEALSAIHETTRNLNQGVTGTTMLIEYWLLRTFGASDVAMRMQSLVSGVAMLGAGIAFLRLKAVQFPGLMAYLAILSGEGILMNYVGEARMYMPLAATTVGTLLYYSLPRTRRHTVSGIVIGWGFVLAGSAYHPYFALYWPAMLLFAYWTSPEREPGFPGLVRFANPALVVTGSLVYLTLGSLTWMRGKATALVDPYNFLVGPLWLELIAPGFRFAFDNRIVLLGLVVACTLLLIGLVRTPGPPGAWFRRVAAPAALIGLALALAAALSAISILQHFWVFPRQWVGSLALIPLGLVWGFSACATYVRRQSQRLSLLAMAIAGVSLTLSAALMLGTQFGQLARWANTPPGDVTFTEEGLAAALRADPQMSVPQARDEVWQEYAKANVTRGGPVWPEFASYYRNIDWTQYVLRDGSQT